MAMNPSSASSNPLSVGNVVSAGVRIYRSHLKQYLMLSLIGHLWILVPIYGWAKYAATTGLISRLAFGELSNQPESLKDARRFINARMWKFLVAAILVILLILGLYMGMALLFLMLAGITGLLVATNPALGAVGALLMFVGIVAFIVVLVLFFCRVLLVEVPLAIEQNVSSTGAISRSWDLTKGFTRRILWTVVVAFLLTLVIYLPSQIIISLLQAVIGRPEETSAASSLVALVSLALSLLTGALVMPFWQVIKAVIYYDLRVRREGLGLRLRDR